MRPPDHVQWEREFDSILKRYRAKVSNPESIDGFTREQAIELLRNLGLTEGEAMWWLNRKAR